MPYTPNNPYIPGDPYSYDLKWLVTQVKANRAALDGLDERIRNIVIRELDQHDPVYYETAQALIESPQKAGSTAYIEGYYTSGDGGANLYYVTDDYNDIMGADFYLTMAASNLWAIPIILTPYVIPEMFGARANGIDDDTAAINTAVKMASKVGSIIFTGGVYRTDQIIIDSPEITIYGNNSLIAQNDVDNTLFTIDSCEKIYIKDLILDTTSAATQNRNLVTSNCSDVTLEHCEFSGQTFVAYDLTGMVNIDGCTQIKLVECKSHDAGGENVTINNSTYCEIIGGEYYDTPNGSAIAVQSPSKYCRINGVCAHDAGGSVIGINAQECEVINCTVYNGSTHGITMGHIGYVADYSKAINNTIFNCTNRGITIQASQHVTISGNIIHGTGASLNFGIAPADAASYLVMLDNVIDNCDRGISVPSNSICSGNRITNSGAMAILCFSCANSLISDNYLSGGTGYGIYFQDNQPTSISNAILNNYISDFAQRGIYAALKQIIQNNVVINNTVVDISAGTSITANNVTTGDL